MTPPPAAELAADAPRRARRTDDPAWLRVLERFGLPTLLTLMFAAYVLRSAESDRQERTKVLAAVAETLQENTAALRALAAEQRAFGEAVRLSWPNLRAPSSSKPPGAR